MIAGTAPDVASPDAVARGDGGGGTCSAPAASGTITTHRMSALSITFFHGPVASPIRFARIASMRCRTFALPTPETLLAEVHKSREGWHLFLYPFAGRPVHLGLANLVAWRVAQHQPRTFSIAVNDYGFELLSATGVDWAVLLPQVLGLSLIHISEPTRLLSIS